MKKLSKVIKEEILKTNDSIPEYWSYQLSQIDDYVNIYNSARQSVLERGALIENPKTHVVKKNPAFEIMRAALSDMTSLIKSFGLTPEARAKILKDNNLAKQPITPPEPEYTTQNFIDDLCQ